MNNPVVHFEMPYVDADRVSAFYGEVFGWTMNQTGEDMGNYVMALTTETGADGRPTTPGVINGGFFARQADRPDQAATVVIAVDDIGAAMRRVTDAGGEVLGEPVQIPGVGDYVGFLDSEGNRASLLQPAARG